MVKALLYRDFEDVGSTPGSATDFRCHYEQVTLLLSVSVPYLQNWDNNISLPAKDGVRKSSLICKMLRFSDDEGHISSQTDRNDHCVNDSRA